MKKGHYTFNVWAVAIDRLLDWRNKASSESAIKSIDNAMEGCRVIMETLPPPSVMNLYLSPDGHYHGVLMPCVKMKWNSELQDMVATYNKEGGSIEYVTTGGED